MLIKEYLRKTLAHKHYLFLQKRKYDFEVIHCFLRARLNFRKAKKVFFVLSTGRCGTKYLSVLLDLAPNAVVLHQPPPGFERTNGFAYDLFKKSRKEFKKIRVKDSRLLFIHANLYSKVNLEIFGDCYNSIFPFGIALHEYLEEEKIESKFIHLVRHPYDCCSSIFMAERPESSDPTRDFVIRTDPMKQSNCAAETASNIWIEINECIRYQMEYIESRKPGSTKLVHIEDLKNIDNITNLYAWLGLELSNINDIKKIIRDKNYTVKHSHKTRLCEIGDTKINEKELSIIKTRTRQFLEGYAYLDK